MPRTRMCLSSPATRNDDGCAAQPDITKAKRYLAWEPTVELKQGLSKMVDDFKTRLARLGEKVVT